MPPDRQPADHPLAWLHRAYSDLAIEKAREVIVWVESLIVPNP
jgi:hypothetical protein